MKNIKYLILLLGIILIFIHVSKKIDSLQESVQNETGIEELINDSDTSETSILPSSMQNYTAADTKNVLMSMLEAIKNMGNSVLQIIKNIFRFFTFS